MNSKPAQENHRPATDKQMSEWPPTQTETWWKKAQLRDVLELVGLPVSKAVQMQKLWRAGPTRIRR